MPNWLPIVLGVLALAALWVGLWVIFGDRQEGPQ